MNIISRAVALAALLVGLTATAAFAAPNDGELGGPADASEIAASSACPTGSPVVGVSGFVRFMSGNAVAQVLTVQCLVSGSTVAGTGTIGEQVEGDNTTDATACPAGQVGVGITGREGDFIDKIVLRCQDDSLTGAITNAVEEFGGEGGEADGPYDCPAGQLLTGLDGTEVFDGVTARAVNVVCASPPAQVHRPCIVKGPKGLLTRPADALLPGLRPLTCTLAKLGL